MFYVLFHYIKKTGKDWFPCSIESKVIQFLRESYEDIKVDQIIEVKKGYRLGLVVTEEYIKSTLEPAEETESLVELVKKPEEIIKKNKKTLEELEAGEPSAMEKIGDDIEQEMKEDKLTDEEKTKKALDDADDLIVREKKREEQRKKGWKLCTECNSNRVAPWNEKGTCSRCQNKRKTNRPYTRNKEFSGL